MRINSKHLWRAVLFSAFLLMLAAGIALAADLITVDGSGSDWNSAWKRTTDTQEGDIPNGVNIGDVYQINDSSKMYWRFDTYANTNWNGDGLGNRAYVFICMDTDNNSSTGYNDTVTCNQNGIDYILRIDGQSGGGVSVSLLDCTSGTCSSASGTLAAATATSINEASVLLSDVGLGGSCSGSRTVQSSIYFDNRTNPPDDRVPNSGTMGLTIYCPTAVTLSSVTAKTESAELPVLPFAAVGLVSVGALGVVTLARRRK
jgi:hypothetical protein